MALRKARAAVSTCPEAEAAAEELLRRGNAIDAVVAGVFAACAVKADVLLGPVQLLMGGGGAGLRALDGRVRQPGIGAPRPRGFSTDAEVPAAARVGVPWLPATLSVAAATSGTATFAQILGPALALAKGSPRGDVLSAIASRGPRALEERPLASELLAAAGRPSEGLLTPDDLSSMRPEVLTARRVEVQAPEPTASSDDERPVEIVRTRDDGAVVTRRRAKAPERTRIVVTLPWAELDGNAPLAPPETEPQTTRLVLAVDRHGTFAAAAWAEGALGLDIPELGLRAPFFAEPVRRGVTRTRPGDPRPAAAPMALVGRASELELALGAFASSDAYGAVQTLVGAFVKDEPLTPSGATLGAAPWLGVASVDGVAAAVR